MTMNLSGSLGAFGLDEVLSMLGMGGRTARMQVRSTQGIGSVHLVDGHVSAASQHLGRAGLLRQLVAESAVPADDLAAALDQDEPVVALVEGAVVSRDTAHRVAVEHIVDALGEMLAWQEGEFAVWSGEADPADIGVRLPVAEAIDRGRARVRDWARVNEALPEPHTVLALAPVVAEGPNLSTEEWSVLARIDGQRTLAEVLASAGAPALQASERIVAVMGRGLVRVKAEHVAEPDRIAALIDSFEGRAAAEEPEPQPVGLMVDPTPEGHPEEGSAVAEGQGAFVEPVSTPLILAGEEPGVMVEPEPAMTVEPEPTVTVEPEQAVMDEPVPVLVEDPAPVPASPWAGVRPPAPAADPAVTAWLESATPAEELMALVGQVPIEGPAPAEAPLPAHSPVPTDAGAEPMGDAAFDLPPAVEPVAWAPVAGVPLPASGVPDPAVAPAVEWSPWAQALGLGAPAPEGELIVDPLAGPGIAQLIAGAHRLADASEVPVPPVPVIPGPQGLGGVNDLPVPREAPGQIWSTTAAQPSAGETETQPLIEAVPAVVPADSSSREGLLSDLMSGVRGD